MLFMRQPDGEDIYANHFSVGRKGQASQRSIVVYVGTDTGAGSWSCSTDGKSLHCKHIVESAKFLNEILKHEAGHEALLAERK